MSQSCSVKIVWLLQGWQSMWKNLTWSIRYIRLSGLLFSQLLHLKIYFFSGVSLKPLKTLSNLFDTYSTLMMKVVPSNLWIRQLSGFRKFTWQQAEHSQVGWATDASFWIFTGKIWDESVTTPDFCGSCLNGILKFHSNISVQRKY